MATRRASLRHRDLAMRPGAGLLDGLTRPRVVRPNQLEPVEDVLGAGCRPQGEEMTTLTLHGVFVLHFDIDPQYLGRAFLDEPWTYVELTSIEMIRDRVNGRSVWRMNADLWDSKLEVFCREWQVTAGEPFSA